MATITRQRGDTWPDKFIRQENGVAIDITGRTYKMSVHSVKAPADDTTLKYRINGVITDAATGAFEFRPSSVNTDITPGTYFYDVEETITGSGYITTLIVDKLVIVQDLTKV